MDCLAPELLNLSPPLLPQPAVVNGYIICPVPSSRWGVLFEVLEDGTAFESIERALEYASGLPELPVA